MSNPLPEHKRHALEKQRADLLEEYEVAYAQLSRELNEVNRKRIERQIADLERQIAEIDAQLSGVFEAPQFDSPKPPRSLRRFPFPGLESMNVGDQDVFFGRDREIRDLVESIKDSFVVVNGLSGCGKSSLVKAGVIPRLREAGYIVLYRAVFENILDDILSQTQEDFDIEATQDWVKTFRDLSRRYPGKQIILIVDQFEQALSPTHDAKALEVFVKGIPQLMAGTESQCIRIMLIVRADWLYYLENSVKLFYPRLNIHSCIYTVDPLSGAAAREAIVRPAEIYGIPYEDDVVTEVIGELERSIEGLVVGKFVQPIQLQIVLRSLFVLAERQGSLDRALTREIYQSSGGVQSILRNYMIHSVGYSEDSWRLLARFIGPDNKTSRTRHHSELRAVPAAVSVESELAILISKGILVAHELPGRDEDIYRLSHDYLVEAIVKYFSANPDQLGWKLAEDWLSGGTIEWRDAGKNKNLLLEQSRYKQIFEYRDKLSLSEDARELLLLTSLRYGHEGLGYWLARGNENENDNRLIVEHLLSPNLHTQETARHAIEACQKASADHEVCLGTTQTKALSSSLNQALESSRESSQREAAARGMWALQSFESAGKRLQVSALLSRYWIRDHALMLSSYLLVICLVLAIVLGGLYIQNALRGRWESIYSLKAGAIPCIAVDPEHPGTIYVISLGGANPREGNSLFVYENGGWQLLSRDFSKYRPTSMILVHNETELNIHLSIYAKGFYMSEDKGQTWSLENRGLPSRAFTSLVVDKKFPQNIYVGTDDWRGVLQSKDGGISWDFLDHSGEIYGASINTLAFVQFDGGRLIAGTSDGRILTHERNGTEWELGYGLNRGRISAIAVAPSAENIIYAGTGRGIFMRSQNGGRTWELMGQIGNQFIINKLVVHPKDHRVIFASSYGNGGNTFWYSQDSGFTWSMLPAIGLPRTHLFDLAFADLTSPDCLLAGTTDGLFASCDGGQTWQKQDLTAPLAEVYKLAVSHNDSAPVYAAVQGSIYTNPDGRLENWVLGKGFRTEWVRAITVDPFDANIAYATGLLMGEWPVFVTWDGGLTWQQTSPPVLDSIVPDVSTLVAARTSDGNTIVYAGTLGCGMFRSDDRGKTWDTFGRTKCSQTLEDAPSDVYFLTVDAEDYEHVYAATGQWLYVSVNGGGSWRYINIGDFAVSSPITGMQADPVDTDVVYIITRSDGFMRSVDGGRTWQKVYSQWQAGTEIVALAVEPEKAGHLIVGASNGGIWRSTNAGEAWHSIKENLAVGEIYAIVSSAGWDNKILISSVDGLALYVPGEFLGYSHR